MGDIADGLINGDFDFFTGEYIGKGFGIPRTKNKSLDWENPQQARKYQTVQSKNIVTGFMSTVGIKQHMYQQVLKDYGCTYPRKSPLRKACQQVVDRGMDNFRKFIEQNKSKYI